MSSDCEKLAFTNHATRALNIAATEIEEIGGTEQTEREVEEVRGVVAVREKEEREGIEKEESATGEIAKETGETGQTGETEATEVIDTANVLGRLVDTAHPEVPGATLTTIVQREQNDIGNVSLTGSLAKWT